MGADQFSQYQEGADADVAFRAAVDQAHYEYGHRGYSGSVAEKTAFVIVSSRPLPRELAEALADRLISRSDSRIEDKWGPAGAIPVRPDDDGGPDDGRESVIGWLFFGWASS